MNNIVTEIFYSTAMVVGRVTPQGVNMLGTCFLVNAAGDVATTHHVIGNDTSNLVVVLPRKGSANGYQDLSDLQCQMAPAQVSEIDPVRDIAILKAGLKWTGSVPRIGSFDSIGVGGTVSIFGYPHCTYGRRAFTFQVAEVGAKVLMDNQGIKSKHAVINVHARPGQSGSPVVDASSGSILGMLVGAWVPGPTGIRLGDINPHELHQTTHCISACHIKEML